MVIANHYQHQSTIISCYSLASRSPRYVHLGPYERIMYAYMHVFVWARFCSNICAYFQVCLYTCTCTRDERECAPAMRFAFCSIWHNNRRRYRPFHPKPEVGTQCVSCVLWVPMLEGKTFGPRVATQRPAVWIRWHLRKYRKYMAESMANQHGTAWLNRNDMRQRGFIVDVTNPAGHNANAASARVIPEFHTTKYKNSLYITTHHYSSLTIISPSFSPSLLAYINLRWMDCNGHFRSQRCNVTRRCVASDVSVGTPPWPGDQIPGIGWEKIVADIGVVDSVVMVNDGLMMATQWLMKDIEWLMVGEWTMNNE